MSGRLEAAVTVLQRGALLAVLWWILTGGAATSWNVGMPAVLVAALASTRMLPPSGISLARVLLFLPAFLLRSLLAAFDVARRTLSPQLQVNPGLVTYRCGLPAGLPRVVLMNIVSLLPGTLSAMQDGADLTVHVLDCRADHASELAALEAVIRRIFPGLQHG